MCQHSGDCPGAGSMEELVALWDVPIWRKVIPATCPHWRPLLVRCHPAISELNPFVSEAIQFIL